MASSCREVKCQKCSWSASRAFGADGILVAPCPQCGARVEYARAWDGDRPVTPDSPRTRKVLTIEETAKRDALSRKGKALAASRRAA